MRSRSKKNEDDKHKMKHHNTNEETTDREKDMDTQKMPKLEVVVVLAICCGLVNMYHVSSMFENGTNFSNLSNLEREMSFRTEMGLYYSYYKDIVEAGSFLSGLNKLMYNNKTEFPDTINTLQRFNLYPELFMGGTYRMFSHAIEYFGLEIPRFCWKVSRGDGLDSVISCDGIGDPFYWYLSGVWLSAGMTAALLFVQGCQLSYSLAGGFLTVACFFFNHGEATRVQWNPPLRESFAFPWSIALNIIITEAMRMKKKSWVVPFLYGTFSLIYLICWQFSQYTLVIHILIAYVMYTLKMLPEFTMLFILLGGFNAFLNNVILQFGNSLLLTSPLAGVLIGILLLYVFLEPVIQHFPFPMNVALQLSCIFISGVATRIEIARIFSLEQDDSHIFNIMRAKLSNFFDFHTRLYTCSPEFDFLPRETLHKLSTTLLLPCSILMIGCWISNTLEIIQNNFAKREREKNRTTNIWVGLDCGVVYNVLLLAVCAVLAMLIMRLKLFFTPQLCVVASLLASRKFWGRVSISVHSGILICLVAVMAIQGSRNILEQRAVIGEYNNPNLEQLIHWVNKETGVNAVFGGPMPTMANLMLSTGRPIVNHPHYENEALRERTKSVYSIFSRKTENEVYETLLSLKVNYVVLKNSWCFGRSKSGCNLLEIWDVEDPRNKQKQPLCPKLFKQTTSPFHKVFTNDEYLVLEVPSKYIEIPPPRILSE